MKRILQIAFWLLMLPLPSEALAQSTQTGVLMTIISGNGQRVELQRVSSAGIVMSLFPPFAPLQVAVWDATHKALPGAQVTWSCDPKLICSGSSVTVTDGNGMVTLNNVRVKFDPFGSGIGNIAGPATVTASHGAARVTFQLMVGPASLNQPVNALKIESGDKQAVPRTGTGIPGGAATFAPLIVQVIGSAGKPLIGARVTWICGSGKPATMICQLDPGGAGAQISTTDVSGYAILNRMGGKSASAHGASGKMPVVASTDNANPVTFDLTVLDPPPPPPAPGLTMTIISGNGQRQVYLLGITAAFAPLQVAVKDTGKPLAGVQVAWSCVAPANASCKLEPSGASTTSTTTDANGVSTLNKMSGYSVLSGEGTLSITASYGTARVTFQLLSIAYRPPQ